MIFITLLLSFFCFHFIYISFMMSDVLDPFFSINTHEDEQSDNINKMSIQCCCLKTNIRIIRYLLLIISRLNNSYFYCTNVLILKRRAIAIFFIKFLTEGLSREVEVGSNLIKSGFIRIYDLTKIPCQVLKAHTR